MSAVRYRLKQLGPEESYVSAMLPDDDGEYILASDYDAAIAKLQSAPPIVDAREPIVTIEADGRVTVPYVPAPPIEPVVDVVMDVSDIDYEDLSRLLRERGLCATDRVRVQVYREEAE